MNKITLFAALLFFHSALEANSCLTIENGKKSLCNNYAKKDAKFVAAQKRLCASGNINMKMMVVENKFTTGICSEDGAIAKCRRKGRDMTIYYTGDFADLEKGCKVFKGAELIKL